MSDLKFCVDCKHCSSPVIYNKPDGSNSLCTRGGFYHAVNGLAYWFSTERERIGIDDAGPFTWKSEDPPYSVCGKDGVHWESKEY